MNYSQFTLDNLLKRVEFYHRIKDQGAIVGNSLSTDGLDHANAELSAIEAELDERQPEGEFVTLLGDGGQPVGFEPHV